MKKIIYAALSLMIIAFISCEKNVNKPDETGKLNLNVGFSIDVHEVRGKIKTTPLLEEFKVHVNHADGSLAQAFASLAEMPDTIDLAVGDYYVEAFSDNNLPAEFDNPYYYGVSDVFSVVSNTLSTAEVNCILGNTIVSVIYSENVINDFASYSTSVSSEYGELTYVWDETRWGYFQPSALDILVELGYTKPDGTAVTRTMFGTIPSPLANRHYEISVDASIVEGMASFLINMDETEVLKESILISDDQGGTPDNGPVYGDLIISEIMSDPSALSDTEGEWFEVYNASSKDIKLQNMIICRDSINWHTIADSIVLGPGDYYVLSRTATATNAPNMYVYGSSITLSNSGAKLFIFSESTESEPGEMIFSVDYGETDFPSAPGKSLSLNPIFMSAANAVLGTSWCLSTTPYNTGDLGTPGTANDSCQ